MTVPHLPITGAPCGPWEPLVSREQGVGLQRLAAGPQGCVEDRKEFSYRGAMCLSSIHGWVGMDSTVG